MFKVYKMPGTRQLLKIISKNNNDLLLYLITYFKRDGE